MLGKVAVAARGVRAESASRALVLLASWVLLALLVKKHAAAACADAAGAATVAAAAVNADKFPFMG